MGWRDLGTESLVTGHVARGKGLGDVEMVWTFWRVDGDLQCFLVCELSRSSTVFLQLYGRVVLKYLHFHRAESASQMWDYLQHQGTGRCYSYCKAFLNPVCLTLKRLMVAFAKAFS